MNADLCCIPGPYTLQSLYLATNDDLSAQPRIAIIGVGLNGLTFLLILHRHGIPATIYERDSSFEARARLSGSLYPGLGWKSDQRALRENVLQGEFDKSSRVECEDLRICDSTGKVPLELGGEGDRAQRKENIRPEINRTVLRKLLLDAAPPDLVQWGHALSSMRALRNAQKFHLTFSNATATISGLLVGAGGAHSRVRPLPSSATPQLLGVNAADILLAPEITKLPALAETISNVGKGAVMAMLGDDGRVRTDAFLRAPQRTIPGC